MITYIDATPKVYAPNATIANQTVLSKTVRAGETFKYLHSDSTRAMVNVTVVAPNTMTIKYSIKPVPGDILQQSLIARSWEEATVQLTMAKGQELEMTLSSDVFIRLTVIGESS